jgi:hypothetical protein
MKELNWEQLDHNHMYSYRSDRLKMAKKLGFNYISECTAKLYYKHQSASKVAELLKLSTAGVLVELKKLGVERRNRGGNHKAKKGRHHWNPLMTNTRAPLARTD